MTFQLEMLTVTRSQYCDTCIFPVRCGTTRAASFLRRLIFRPSPRYRAPSRPVFCLRLSGAVRHPAPSGHSGPPAATGHLVPHGPAAVTGVLRPRRRRPRPPAQQAGRADTPPSVS